MGRPTTSSPILPPMAGLRCPPYFIAGEKLRWDGKELVVHDGISEVLRHKFKVLTQGQPTESYTYTASQSGEDLTITGVSYSSRVTDIPRQLFSFWKANTIDAEQLAFFGGFGVDVCSTRRIDDDNIYFANAVMAVEALLYEGERGQQRCWR